MIQMLRQSLIHGFSLRSPVRSINQNGRAGAARQTAPADASVRRFTHCRSRPADAYHAALSSPVLEDLNENHHVERQWHAGSIAQRLCRNS